jgi:hypothetical protein
MAKENRRFCCQPAEEERCVTLLQTYGWKIAHRQEVFDSHEVFDGSSSFSNGWVGGGTVYTHEEVVNYISFLLERDLGTPKSQALAELERQRVSAWERYQATFQGEQRAKVAKKKSSKEIDHMGVWGAILLAIGVMFLVIGFVNEITPLIVFGFLAAVPGAGLFVAAIVRSVLYSQRPIPKDMAAETERKQILSEISDLDAQALKISETREIPAPTKSDPKSQLEKLKSLHDEGILTDKEYEAKRKALVEKL